MQHSRNFLQTEALTTRVATDPPGIINASARAVPGIVIHVGPSVQIACRRGGQCHRGLAVHGDVDIIPAGIPSRWEVMRKDTALIIAVQAGFLHSVARERGIEPDRVEIVNRFQTRDPQIEHIGWALKAQMECRQPVSRLYADSLATALALRLLERHSTAAPIREDRTQMPGHRLRLVLSYIEDNLGRDLSLAEIALVAGIGLSQFKKVFRESMGLPVHRYVIQRRVERAKALLEDEKRSIAEIALDTGFAHQSHLARHMRRITGFSPQRLRENLYRE